MPYDAILIPGGGVRAGGQLPPWVERRLERVLEVQQGEFLVVLSAGTVHRPPPLTEHGFPVFEAVAGARFLMERGIPPSQVLIEAASYDTIGNAFFARLLHTDPLGLRRLLVVNSEFHMMRTEAIFRWVFGLDAPEPPYELSFESVPNVGIGSASLEARKAREEESLERVHALQPSLLTLRALHDWFFREHAAYGAASSADRLLPGPGGIPGLDTY